MAVAFKGDLPAGTNSRYLELTGSPSGHWHFNFKPLPAVSIPASETAARRVHK
jgi:hypothetical protein